MRRFILAGLVLPTALAAQAPQLVLPKVSPRAMVGQTVGKLLTFLAARGVIRSSRLRRSQGRHGGSLEERFLERAGRDPEAARKLSWLEERAP